jgi:predicted GNAT family acetyltransferase
LTTEHAGFALGSGLARRYPAEVIPFGALAEPSVEALTALRDLLGPEETIYLSGLSEDSLPRIEGLISVREIPGWQMHLAAQANTNPPEQPEQKDAPQVQVLEPSEAPIMLALTDVAFPGFYRLQTHKLGSYYGIRVNGELVAMAGERVALPGSREISAVCTHPAHTGKGYAASLIQHLLRVHQAAGLHSFLHVAAATQRAIDLYERLGFVKTTPVIFHQLRRI